MRELRAVLFGIDTLVDGRDVERKAYNRVFEEAGLSWRWDVVDYARLRTLSTEGDVLDAFIRFERPCWHSSEDFQHLLVAVRRRHASLCGSIATEFVDINREMAAVARLARTRSLLLCAIVSSGFDCKSEALDGVALARSYEDALVELDVPASACIAIECTGDGVLAAADAGVVSIDRRAVSGASDEAIMNALRQVHAISQPVSRHLDRFAPALIA